MRKKSIVNVHQFDSQEAQFEYLRKNADKIIAQKKSLPTTTDDLDFGYSIGSGKAFASKAAGMMSVASDTEGEINVEVIANVSGWCDSQMDVMLKDSWKKSINDLGASGQRLFYHLKDHEYEMDAIIGKEAKLYSKDISLDMFNIFTDIKKAQALIMSSIVSEIYAGKCFHLYKDGEIKQHSIGLQYHKIYLCMNSNEAEDVQYKENWDKYYSQVINKDKVDAKGYFWAVAEARILEVSAVLFGANELTPTLSTGKESTINEPSHDTQDQPQDFDIMEAIRNAQFINM